MRRHPLLLASFILFAALPACAQEHDHAGARQSSVTFKKNAKQPEISLMDGKMVGFPSSPGNANGYLSLPSGSGKHPAIIVIQEWWGMNDWIIQQTDRFAKQGYVALAVDLYRGKSTSDPEVAHELMRGLPDDRAIADLKAGFKFLASRSDVDAKHIGVIGWCMGGGYSLGLALAEPRVAATVINYGRLVTDPATIAKIDAPILGNFGETDRGITPADVKAFQDALAAAKKPNDIKEYPGAGHGFMNPNNKDGYNAAAARDAWERVDSFLSRALRGS